MRLVDSALTERWLTAWEVLTAVTTFTDIIYFPDWKRTVHAEMNAAKALHKYNVSRKAGLADFRIRKLAEGPSFYYFNLTSNRPKKT